MPLHTRLLRILGFLSAALVSAAIIVGIAFRFLDSPKEKKMRQDVVTMQEKYLLLQKQIESLSDDVSDLEQRDNDIYRSIFEAAPLPDSVRLGKEYSQVDWEQYKFKNTNELIDEVGKEIASLKHRISTQKNSFDTLKNLVQS
ncbi:MAG: M23 family peptidase, partial [Bacteroidetes bacterium]|nr:M23 family peptidase [Bacteroidota bacterium]